MRSRHKSLMHFMGWGADLIASLTATAQDLAPAVAQICSNLAGIRNALRRLRAEPAHTWQDIHHYQVASPSRPGCRLHGAAALTQLKASGGVAHRRLCMLHAVCLRLLSGKVSSLPYRTCWMQLTASGWTASLGGPWPRGCHPARPEPPTCSQAATVSG